MPGAEFEQLFDVIIRFGVWGLGFGVWGFGFEVLGLGFSH